MSENHSNGNTPRGQMLGLLEDHFSGNLDAEGRGRLLSLLEQHPELGEEARRLVLQHGVLAECFRQDADVGGAARFVARTMEALDEALGREAAVLVRPDAASSRFRLFWPLAAAGLALAAGLVWRIWESVPRRSLGREGRSRVARVVEASGEWPAFVRSGELRRGTRVASGGRDRRLAVEDEVREGDGIETGVGGKVVLAWVGGETEVTLSDKSDVSVVSDKRLELRFGKLTSVVAKQEAGKSFVVETPQARVEVVGTRFGIRAEEKASWLSVDEGMVRFVRKADGAGIDVAAGHFAVAGAKAEDFALKAYPAGTEWVDGPIILEDDFEEDMNHWEILKRPFAERDERRFESVGEEGARYASIEKRARDGGPVSCLVLNAPPESGLETGIRLKRAPEAAAFAVEWEGASELAGTIWSPVWLGVTLVESTDSDASDAVSVRSGTWVPWRLELRPVAGDGERREMRVSIGGSPSSRTVAESHERGGFAIAARNGRVAIDRVVVRELIRARRQE